jgi:hypothetical protein
VACNQDADWQAMKFSAWAHSSAPRLPSPILSLSVWRGRGRRFGHILSLSIALIIISVIIRFIATGSKLAARRQYVAEVIDMDVAASPMYSTTSRSIKKAFCGVCGNTKSSSPDTKFCEFCGKEFK